MCFARKPGQLTALIGDRNATITFPRRRFLGTAAALSVPTIVSAAQPLKVGTYGGFFKDSFKQFIFSEFTKATEIEVNSAAVPTGETWLVQIKNVTRAKTAPADVSLMAGIPRSNGAAHRNRPNLCRP
ncbi:hypothetical protein [Ruegeria sp. HKCCA5491]|uniref:hypothetical protein n=1 Tax=Ruegeria sp. HKCCA5491 TaxID=2682986 RepID=UPI001489C874|nr:hypothetical protein [Ruegeria sp. HKCCA5491]